MHIKIDTWVRKSCTIGTLEVGKFKCFTLELPWLNNARNISCIPAGTYKATKYSSPTQGDVILLHGVPDRSYVEIHVGNFTKNTNGCILVGSSITHVDSDGVPDVGSSKSTMRKLLENTPYQMTVTITRVGGKGGSI